jgi:transposase-like protein
MKFNLFGRKYKCNKCGSKFKDETELMATTGRFMEPKIFLHHTT